MTWQGHPVMSPNQYLELTQDIRINSYVTNSGEEISFKIDSEHSGMFRVVMQHKHGYYFLDGTSFQRAVQM